MANKKTLIILTPGFPASEADSTCLPFLQTHIRAINKEYPELEVIVLAFQYPYYKGRYDWYDNEVISFDGRDKPKAYRALVWWKVWSQLKMLKKQKNIHGLLSIWCTECAMVGSRFARQHYLKHYTCLCGQDAKPGNKYVARIKPKAKYLVATSDFLKATFYKSYGITPANVIPWGIDEDMHISEPSVRDIDVLGAGSLIPLKQYDVFVKVINKIAQELPAVKAMICGKGPEHSNLDNLIKSLNREQNLLLAGEREHKELLQLMRRAKVFVHTSSYEGFGVVCIEALAEGTPVVSFTKPMNKAIPNWYHVNTEAEMVEKVTELLLNPSPTYGSITPYNARNSAKQMMELYSI